MKTCTKCKIEKEDSEFHVFSKAKDGLYSQCKICKRKYDGKYRKSIKSVTLTQSDSYKKRKRNYREYIAKLDPRITMLSSAKQRARKFNIPCTITVEDIIIPSHCPILEIPIFRKIYGQGGSFQPNSPSLDRIVPEKGYIKDNIIVISMKANAMKYNASYEELKLFSQNILKIFKYGDDYHPLDA